MRCLSLWQPWASLIAIGAKKIETRSWSTDFTGPLAIHAAKKSGFMEGDALRAAKRALNDAGWDWQAIPTGQVIAVCKSIRCVQIMGGGCEANLADGTIVKPPELYFGHYAPGRFAFILEGVTKLTRPFEWIGRQKWFDVPDELIEAAK